MGHSKDDRTRYSVALLSSNDGSPGLPTSRGYDTFLAASQAFQLGSLGVQRIGAFAYIGQAPTYFQFTSGNTVAAKTVRSASRHRNWQPGFYRAGFIGQFFIKKYDLTAMYFHSCRQRLPGDRHSIEPATPAGRSAESHVEWRAV